MRVSDLKILSYHDTWISVDPIRGCPYSCSYCILRDSNETAKRPRQLVTPKQCVELLCEYKLFVRDETPLAIGNDTDILHPANVEYLAALVDEMRAAGLRNPIVLPTKSPLRDRDLERIRGLAGGQLALFLSHSGLGRQYEPNFTEEGFRENFRVAKKVGIPVVHYWRPLLPENTTPQAVEEMLAFVSQFANASVFTGLKLHPRLNRLLTEDGSVDLPQEVMETKGEWLTEEAIERIYAQGRTICPRYPMYRHSSCALAVVLRKANHTATVYRDDICPASQCPALQRMICTSARRSPSMETVREALSRLEIEAEFTIEEGHVTVDTALTQEEFAFVLHRVNFPLRVRQLNMQRLYHGSIFEGQPTLDRK